MPFEPPPNADLGDVAKATILVSKIEEMGFVLEKDPTDSNPWSWRLVGTASFPCGPRSYRHFDAPKVALASHWRQTAKSVHITCPSRTAERKSHNDALDVDVARVFAVDAFFEYCVALKESRKQALETRRKHAVLTEEFNGPDGWQRSPAVCFLECGEKDRWAVESDGAPASISASGLTRAAMRVLRNQILVLNTPVSEPYGNSLRSQFLDALSYADKIDAVPAPVIPDFPRRLMAARKAFKDWSWA